MSLNEAVNPDIIINPYYATNFSSNLFSTPTPQVSSEDWVLLNANLMEDIGSKVWLEELLNFLSQSHEEYDGHDIINPTLVILLSDKLREKHDTLVSRNEWIAANRKLINEIGTAQWLQRLLTVLTSSK